MMDMHEHEIVDSGQTWPYSKKPCRKEMLPMLEQNESVITWITRKGSTDVSDQVPVIRVGRDYYSISLRMMKAVWRHVRLASGFVNKDTSKDGSLKLRIPLKLLSEKKRTQNRFNVRSRQPPSPPFPSPHSVLVHSGPLHPYITLDGWQRACVHYADHEEQAGGGGTRCDFGFERFSSARWHR